SGRVRGPRRVPRVRSREVDHGNRGELRRRRRRRRVRSFSMAAKIEPYCPSTVYKAPGYSQAIKVTGAQTILFLAGQVAYTPDGGAAHPGDFTAQGRAVFGALKKLVEAGGGTLASVVKITTYVTDVGNRPAFRTVRDE